MQIKLTTGHIFDLNEGETLQDALKRNGVYLVASCGGKGICGKCKIKVIEGKYRTESIAKLTPEEIEQGFVLACKTFVVSEDITIDIPKTSKLVVGDIIEISRTKDLFELFTSIEKNIQPLINWLDIDIPAPTLDNNLSDLERLKRIIEEKGINSMEFSLDFVRSLPEILRKLEWKIRLAYINTDAGRKAMFIKSREEDKSYGIAVDIGTTTIVLYLVDLSNGKVIDTGSTYNSQIRFGDDVITRIIQATEGGMLDEMRENVVEDINNLLQPLLEKYNILSDEIHSAVIAGNTTMSHLFWGINPGFIREEPYVPVLNSFPVWSAGKINLSINKNAPVYTLPCVASYVGGDIVSGVIASKINLSKKISLFMDIGTNGEIVLGNEEWLVTAACSAGPCFEGSGIRHGMRATEGAIESVKIIPGTSEFVLGVIGNKKPIGICGSGMIDALTEMFMNGAIDQKGKIIKNKFTERIKEGFEGPEFILYKDDKREIVLTEVDIENLIRAKAAIFAGISLLLRETGFTFDDIEKIYIAGGFGNYLNIEKAIFIGMLPDIPREKFRFLGNTSIAGAYMCLLSENVRREAEYIAGKMTNIELSVSRGFMDEYISALFLPHTNIELYPSVKNILARKNT
ncbi:MAG: DUF4445 domain-containing protein [Nitrospirae bacterium]|jgi:uncharacterized 2Fe-2S/4Fe-4S cluster protein (DUF4445 family)|nr:DUF4445 domain-containing protein [Nitrospirota bacterium]